MEPGLARLLYGRRVNPALLKNISLHSIKLCGRRGHSCCNGHTLHALVDAGTMYG
jgi:hypothetical protein